MPVPLRIGEREIEAYRIVGALSREGPAAADVGALHDLVRSVMSQGSCVVVQHDPAILGPGHHHHSLDCVGDCARVALPLLGVADASGSWLMGPKKMVRELCSVSEVSAAHIAESHPLIDDFSRFSHLWNGSMRVSQPEGPRSLGAALGQGLGEMHRRGIVHGDVRSHNIFVQDDGRVMFYGDLAGAKFVCASAPPELFATDLVHVLEMMIPSMWEGFRERYTQEWPGGHQVVEFVERSGHPTWQAAVDAGDFMGGLRRIDEVLSGPSLNNLERMALLASKGMCLAQLGRPQASAEVNKEALRLAIGEELPDDVTNEMRYTLAVSLSLAGDDAAALSTLTALMAKARKGHLHPDLQERVAQSIETINRRRG
ncbi:hypothetical protein ABZ078_16775 [Streptomyces sp. NPDC006385]|uniref:hypothetical protein n=1 Tax=Streptomyces sp. NPDC006385 TaxID=3156761 RepID=UPI0033B1C766